MGSKTVDFLSRTQLVRPLINCQFDKLPNGSSSSVQPIDERNLD
jgi:hypothetical protein